MARKKKVQVKAEGRRANKELILKALTDARFRRLLAKDPEQALGVEELTEENKKEIAFVLATVKGIDAQIRHIGDELLCAGTWA